MSNFQLLFLHGFSSKNCEILNKAVLTPQEYNDYFFWKKNQKKMPKKIKKPVGGVCSSQDWSQKIPLAKRFFSQKNHFLNKHPQIAKKWVQSLKNRNFCYFFQVLPKKSKQNARNQKVKVTFLPKMVLKLQELERESNFFA